LHNPNLRKLVLDYETYINNCHCKKGIIIFCDVITISTIV